MPKSLKLQKTITYYVEFNKMVHTLCRIILIITETEHNQVTNVIIAHCTIVPAEPIYQIKTIKRKKKKKSTIKMKLKENIISK